MPSTSASAANASPRARRRRPRPNGMPGLRLTCDAAMVTGTVKALWRWPVIPLAGERLRSTRVEETGVAGDRQHVLAGPVGPLSLQDAPPLTAWTAGYPFNPDGAIVGHHPPYPILTAPESGGSFPWGDPRLKWRLERAAGMPLELLREPEARRPVVVA